MWKKENPPADPVGSFKMKPESKEAPKMPKADKPEPEVEVPQVTRRCIEAPPERTVCPMNQLW